MAGHRSTRGLGRPSRQDSASRLVVWIRFFDAPTPDCNEVEGCAWDYMEKIDAMGRDDVTVLIGGIIPDAGITALKKADIAEVFLPSTATKAIVDFIRQCAAPPPANSSPTNARKHTVSTLVSMCLLETA